MIIVSEALDVRVDKFFIDKHCSDYRVKVVVIHIHVHVQCSRQYLDHGIYNVHVHVYGIWIFSLRCTDIVSFNFFLVLH